jgi:ribose transport system substrate-binding protein
MGEAIQASLDCATKSRDCVVPARCSSDGRFGTSRTSKTYLEETMLKNTMRMAATALVLIGATTLSHAADKKQIYFVPNGAVDFWKLAEAGIKKAQAELPNYSLQIKYPEQSSAAIQNRLMDDLVSNGAAGIMVSSVDPKTQVDALNRIASQTVLFTTDSDAAGSKRVGYIGSSNLEAGKQAGEILKKALPNGGTCMAFVGLPGADNARERLDGIRATIKDTKITITDIRADDMDQSRAKRNVEDTVTARSDVNCMIGVYAYNTPEIYGALKEAGKLGQITVVGFDEDQVTLGGVKEGAIAGTVVQQPFEWGYQGMKDIAKYIEGDKSFLPANGLMIVPTQIIDKSNVDAFWSQLKERLGKK